MYKKSVVHVQSCCFANQTYCFFDVLVTVRVFGSYSLYRIAPKSPFLCVKGSPVQRGFLVSAKAIRCSVNKAS